MFNNRTLVVATMHGKEAVIGPPLAANFRMMPILCQGLDTDQFGTFTGEHPRLGSQREAALAKAQAALDLTGETLAVSSEGSFSPHPALPWVTANLEMVLLLDLKNNWEIVGEAFSLETNARQAIVRTQEEALAFAEQIGLPDHALVLKAPTQTQPHVTKGIASRSSLLYALDEALKQSVDGSVQLEADMRAFCNPTRMQVIHRATLDLVKRLQSHCPACRVPGFAVSRTVAGLPCAWCGLPTAKPKKLVYACIQCSFEKEQAVEGSNKADPGECFHCNP